MPDLTIPQSVEVPVQTVVIARSGMGTGDGGDKVEGKTPANRSNIVSNVMTPFAVILVRCFRVYLQTFLGLLSVGGLGATTDLLPVGDLGTLIAASATLSLGSAFYCAVQNVIELLTKFDQSHPTLTV